MKMCTKCGVEKPLDDFKKDGRKKSGRGSVCKVCHNKENSIYAKANPEGSRRRSNKWRMGNLEKARERFRLWRKSNLEKARELTRAWFKSHPDYELQWRLNNPEKKRVKDRKWWENHPEKRYEYQRNYVVRKKGNGGSITNKEWEALKAFYNYTCLSCLRKEPEITLTLDHVMPIKLGGENTINNVQCLCRSCNSSKGAKYIDFREEEYHAC